jgi:peptide/nickel transport system permease protein
MRSYIIRRLIISVPLLLAITFVSFMVIHMAPGNYFDSLRMNPQISPETIKKYESQYHLDKPPVIQYGWWLKNILRFDLGYSFSLMSPVKDVIGRRLFNTFILSLSAMLFTWFIAIPLGIFCAVKQNKISDRFFSGISFVGLSVPTFFLALILLYIVSVTGILPLGGMYSAGYESFSRMARILDLIKHLIIPTIVIGTGSMAGLQRIMRANMLEVLRQQYIITARAKGLPEHRVIYIHALRNAVNPLITIFGYSLSGLLSGAALTEIIIGWPGLGSVMLQAVRSQDLFLVMGSMLMGGVLLIGGNLIADILLAWSDPRIQYR